MGSTCPSGPPSSSASPSSSVSACCSSSLSVVLWARRLLLGRLVFDADCPVSSTNCAIPRKVAFERACADAEGRGQRQPTRREVGASHPDSDSRQQPSWGLLFRRVPAQLADSRGVHWIGWVLVGAAVAKSVVIVDALLVGIALAGQGATRQAVVLGVIGQFDACGSALTEAQRWLAGRPSGRGRHLRFLAQVVRPTFEAVTAVVGALTRHAASRAVGAGHK